VIACGQVTPGSHPQTVVVGLDQAGKTIQARVGDTVRVTLKEEFPVPGSSLVWDVSSSAPEVLAPARVTRDPATRPQRGEVSYTADFKAVTSGQASLMAIGHTTCEAMAKPACPDQDFTVTVQVQA
jgi:predicted secreted protein